ncbi:MAG TPA: serine/threonine protein kinase, partial [Solibacterales bacterium]|nr:serine/threonine protein kinase [Bryobacterales bacterium]
MRVLAFFLTAALASAQSWPQFRNDPALTGVTAATLPAEPRLLWSIEAGEIIESSAAIAEGAVYVGTGSSELLAIDLASGKIRWRYKTKEPIGESSPAVAGGAVYVADLNGTLHAVSAKDGKGLWTFPLGSEVKSSPVIVDGKVIIGSYDGHLYAVNAAKGELAWRFKTNGPVHATAAVINGVAYISGCDGTFRGIRVSDGKEAAELRIGSYMGSSPVMAGIGAYFGTYDNQVIGLDLKAKKIAWRYEHPQRKFPYSSSAAYANGKVLIGGRDKMVHCLDGQTGKALWTYMTRARVDSSPAVAGGRVWFGSNDGRLYAVQLADGKKVWEFDAGGGG